MQQRLYFAILFFILLATLLALTYYPDLPDVKLHVKDKWIRLDYIGHLGFYAALATAFLLWRTGWRKKVPVRMLLFTLLAGFAFGVITEFTQRFVHGRAFNPLDMLYNCIGILAGIAFIFALGKRIKNSPPLV
jgi:VanZ family protein